MAARSQSGRAAHRSRQSISLSDRLKSWTVIEAGRITLARHEEGMWPRGWGGIALVAAGTGLRSWLATVVGGGLVAWSIADAADRVPASPGSVAGRIALWPLEADPAALAAVVDIG